MASRAERSVRNSPASREVPAKRRIQFSRIWPQIWRLVGPRKWILLGGTLLMLVNRVSGLVLPASTKYFIDVVLRQHKNNLLLPLIGGVFLATLIQAVTSFTLTQMLSKAAQRLIADLRKEVQRHVGLLSVSYYDSNRTGVLVSRIMTDVEGVRNLIGTGLVDLVGGVFTAAIAFAYLMHISTKITVTVFVVLACFTLILRKGMSTIRPVFRERGKINAEVQGRLTESLGGVRVIKGYHSEEREAGVFAKGADRLLDNVMKTMTATSVMSFSATTALGVIGGLVMLMGANAVLGNHMTLGDYFSYNMFLAFMVAPLFQMVNIGTQLTEAFAGLDRTGELMAEMEEAQDPDRVEAIGPLAGNVTFEDVNFAYETDKPVLSDVSFEAKAGSVTALVGSSGSGKSTIISLVCAFHKPISGRVLVDGHDLSHVRLENYRSQLGVVLQESFLFDGTIRENILFSRPEATEEQFHYACRTARVDEFAERFPDGYDTVVGERGVKLSGGQRQRLSIARALLAEPRILILDEATSSLDSESEALIQQGLVNLMQGRTTFVIAHRLSTIRRADQILVVEGGRIVERGRHEDLYALNGRYSDLYNRQHGIEMNLFLAPGEGDKVETPETA